MWLGQQFWNAVHIRANQVFHHHIIVPRAIAQRQPRDRADMLLELIDCTAVLRPMAGIMHPRGDFIHDQPLAGDKELDTHHADIIQRIEDLAGDQDRIHPKRSRQAGGHCGGAQNAAFVDVFARIKASHIAAYATCGDHRHLVAEVDETLQNRGRIRHVLHRLRGIAVVTQAHLTLAVIAKAAGFQNRRSANVAHSAAQILGAVDLGVWRGFQTQIGQEILFSDAVLADTQRLAAWSDGAVGFQYIQRGCGNVFKLIGDHIHRLRKGDQRCLIFIGRGCDLICHLAGWRVGTGLKDMAFIAKPRGRDRKHAAQLASAKNANGAAKRKWGAHWEVSLS